MFTQLLLYFYISFANANPTCLPADDSDALEVYVLTSGPGNGVYTKVGHSALWVSGGGKRETIFNWGAYDSSQENFLWHFFMGSAEYKLAMMSRPYNLKRVKENEQRLVAQHLDLSPNMKLALAGELARLARPENHVYTYHWETQNCSTLIRDLIDEVTSGALQSLPEPPKAPTRRFEVLRHLGSLTWTWFGWHYMGSDYADREYNRWEWMHIPYALHNGLNEATITWEGEQSPRSLVDRTCVLNEGEWAPNKPPQRGVTFVLLGLMMGLWTIYSYKRPWFWSIPNALFFGASGLLSSFFIGCWLFSSLEGYGFNENWFVSNPLHCLVGWMLLRKQSKNWVYQSLSILLLLGVCWKLFDSTPQENWGFIGLFGIPTICWLTMTANRQMRQTKIDG